MRIARYGIIEDNIARVLKLRKLSKSILVIPCFYMVLNVLMSYHLSYTRYIH